MGFSGLRDDLVQQSHLTVEERGSKRVVTWPGSHREETQKLGFKDGPDDIKILPIPEHGENEVHYNDPLTLECQAQSYLPAQYEWHVKDTSGPVHSGSTYTIMHASWKHSGKVFMLGKEQMTNLSISMDITIKVVGGNVSSLSGGAIAGIVSGVLAGAALIGALIYFLFFRKTRRASEHHHTEHKSSAPNHRHTYSDSSPNRTVVSMYIGAQKPPAMAQSPAIKDIV